MNPFQAALRGNPLDDGGVLRIGASCCRTTICRTAVPGSVKCAITLGGSAAVAALARKITAKSAGKIWEGKLAVLLPEAIVDFNVDLTPFVSWTVY
ncbi:MAG: hypothetical protein WCA20_24775 [Candidatus Sulfotelmatobacter sp.]